MEEFETRQATGTREKLQPGGETQTRIMEMEYFHSVLALRLPDSQFALVWDEWCDPGGGGTKVSCVCLQRSALNSEDSAGLDVQRWRDTSQMLLQSDLHPLPTSQLEVGATGSTRALKGN